MNYADILIHFLAALGLIAAAANALSMMVPKDSAISPWLAWIASMPIRHAPPKQTAAPKEPLAPILPLALMIAVSLTQPGCVNASVIHTKVQQAQLIEDKVHTQVVVLQTVFESAAQWLPREKRAEYVERLQRAELVLQNAMDAKDAALQAALEASSDNVDLVALIPPIVKAIESIISIIADVRSQAKALEPRALAGAPDDVLEVQLAKARGLAVSK